MTFNFSNLSSSFHLTENFTSLTTLDVKSTFVILPASFYMRNFHSGSFELFLIQTLFPTSPAKLEKLQTFRLSFLAL